MSADLGASIKEVFRNADTENSGLISKEQFAQVLREIGVKKVNNDLELLFQLVDMNSDGMLSYDEIMDWIMHEAAKDDWHWNLVGVWGTESGGVYKIRKHKLTSTSNVGLVFEEDFPTFVITTQGPYDQNYFNREGDHFTASLWKRKKADGRLIETYTASIRFQLRDGKLESKYSQRRDETWTQVAQTLDDDAVAAYEAKAAAAAAAAQEEAAAKEQERRVKLEAMRAIAAEKAAAAAAAPAAAPAPKSPMTLTDEGFVTQEATYENLKTREDSDCGMDSDRYTLRPDGTFKYYRQWVKDLYATEQSHEGVYKIVADPAGDGYKLLLHTMTVEDGVAMTADFGKFVHGGEYTR